MKWTKLVKANENEEVVKQRLEELARLLDEEGSISYGEINYLQDHQEEVKKYFPNNSTMWQWADISEEEWNNHQASKQVKADKENMTTYDFNFHNDTVDNEVLEQIDYLTSAIKKEFTKYVKSGNGNEQVYDNLLLLLARTYNAIVKIIHEI